MIFVIFSCDNLTNHSSRIYAVINWLWWLLMAPSLLLRRFLFFCLFLLSSFRLVIMTVLNSAFADIFARFLRNQNEKGEEISNSVCAILLCFNLFFPSFSCISFCFETDSKCIHNFTWYLRPWVQCFLCIFNVRSDVLASWRRSSSFFYCNAERRQTLNFAMIWNVISRRLSYFLSL